MSDVLPPLALAPKSVTTIWGGTALVERFGKQPCSGSTIAESWECWDENAVTGGAFDRKTIALLRGELGHELVGSADPSRPFPLLTKLIDARDTLSVQVHPGDDYAMRVEGKSGKTECWVILEAEPNASIVLGWERDTSREEFERRVADGSLGELLHRITVTPGDVYYLPAGTVHAIGAGIVLYEAQQTSDLTYRIFDWNRLGADGKPRDLHVAKAADVLNYRADGRGAVESLDYRLDGAHRVTLVAGSHFILERIELDAGQAATIGLDGMPLAIMALAEPLEASETLRLRPYETAVVPAAAANVSLRAFDSETAVLAAAPVASAAQSRAVLTDRWARAGLAPGRVAAFLDQF